MPNYADGKIYKIVCNETGLQYYGSTIQKLSHRLAKHRDMYATYLRTELNYVTSYKVLENNDYSIVLVEMFPCTCKDELLGRERHHADNNVCVNKNRARITDEERQAYRKEYRQESPNILLSRVRLTNNDYFKNYYLKNKEHIQERKSKKYTCECGREMLCTSKKWHEKSKVHLKLTQ